MKVIFLSLIILGLYGAVEAQPIFIPFEGRREAIETADFTPGEIETLKTGKLCGQYFSYEEAADQKIVSFKVPVSGDEDRQGIYGFHRIELKLLEIKIDNDLKAPLIEYRSTKIDRRTKKFTEPRGFYIFSMSAKDFREATCLADLR